MTKTTGNLAIKLTNLSKMYQLHHEKPTLVENLFKINKKETFIALDDINLEIYKGEKIGIIGSNGSGKTTLLKVISKITTPTKGNIKTWGKVVSLIDLSAGFHPELTGRENVFLNALLLGMGKEKVVGKYKDIVEFADIGSFIDSPLYTYSSGMKLKLGFSVAVATDPDILILDEGIAAGDENFQIKSDKKMKELFKEKVTFIVVTHWLDYVREHCQRVIWVDKGRIVADGGLDLVDKYEVCMGEL